MTGRRLAALIFLAGYATHAAAELHWIDRPDDMHVYGLHDVDRYGDGLRILYSTKPSAQQYKADPARWRENVYVVEIRVDGSVEQRRLSSRQSHLAALMLRRGHDEVVVVRAPGPGGGAQRLEVWSAQEGSLRSAAAAPDVPGADAAGTLELASSTATGDGNLFVARGNGSGAIAWYRLSPRGVILANGEYAVTDAAIGVLGSFGAPDGGGGLLIRASAGDPAAGLQSDIETPIRRTIGGRMLEARVFGETRVLVSDPSGMLAWVSPALTRQLMWGGEMQLPPSVPLQERMRQLREQMHMIEGTELELGARRTLVTLERGGSGLAGIKAVPGGYGVLATVTARRDREPRADGLYYLEVGRGSERVRELYLEPAARALDAAFVKYVDFLRASDGSLLLAGRIETEAGRWSTTVTQVSGEGALLSNVLLEAPPDGKIDGIVGVPPNVWVLGHARHEPSGKLLLWVEAVD